MSCVVRSCECCSYDAENCTGSAALEELEAEDFADVFETVGGAQVLTKYVVRNLGRCWRGEFGERFLTTSGMRWKRVAEGAEDC